MNTDSNLEAYSREYTQELSPTLKNIIQLAEQELAYTDMFSSVTELKLYQHIIACSGYNTVLELGMFCGLSTMAFAECIPKQGKVITIEPNRRYIDIALRAWENSYHQHKIEIRANWAQLEIAKIIQEKKTFDFIFIDADKENYPVYYDVLLPLLNPMGTMVLDNMYWYGKTVSDQDKKGLIIHQLNQQILSDTRVDSTFLPLRDGVVLIRKR
jgi:predicted O-methyltransferase YrrM